MYSAVSLKLHRVWQNNSCGRGIASSQADATWRGVLCLKKMAPRVWGMTQRRDPGGCSFSSFPRATNPRFSPSISSPLCPPSAGAQGQWQQASFCALALKRLSESLAISPWQTGTQLLLTSRCYLGSFPALVLLAWELSLGSWMPHFLGETPGC